MERAIKKEEEITGVIVSHLESLGGAESTFPLIEKAFAKQLVDPMMTRPDLVKQSIARADEEFHKTIERLKAPDQLLSSLEQWAMFEDDEIDDELDEDFIGDSALSSLNGLLEADDYVPENETTVRNEDVKVGRNDKCPCGSGKKYKKCCGSSSAITSIA